MASIKISNLPDLTPDRVTSNDYFIVNDENQTTTKLRFADLVEAVGGENITFSGVVSFTGSVSIDVIDDTASNVYTKTSVNTLIAESEARSAALVQDNTDDITRLVSLTKAPSTGGIYPGTTFGGAANGQTNLVDAINAVAGTQETNDGRVTVLEGLVNQNTSAIAANTTSISNLDGRVGNLETVTVDLDTRLTDVETELSALSTVVGDTNAGLVSDISSLGNRVTALEGQVADIETTLGAGGAIKTEIEAAQTAADNAQSFAESNNAEYRTLLAEAAAEIVTETATAVSNGTLDAASLSAIITDAIGAALAANNHSGI